MDIKACAARVTGIEAVIVMVVATLGVEYTAVHKTRKCVTLCCCLLALSICTMTNATAAPMLHLPHCLSLQSLYAVRR